MSCKYDNTKKHNCINQLNIGGFYYCKLVRDREKALNEKNDDVKYGGVVVHSDDRCVKKRGCGYSSTPH